VDLSALDTLAPYAAALPPPPDRVADTEIGGVRRGEGGTEGIDRSLRPRQLIAAGEYKAGARTLTGRRIPDRFYPGPGQLVEFRIDVRGAVCCLSQGPRRGSKEARAHRPELGLPVAVSMSARVHVADRPFTIRASPGFWASSR
jgi:hypothetical protein